MTRFTSCVVAGVSLIILIVIPAKAGIYFESQPVEPLVDSPATTIGSDFNGDGIHDLVVGANLNDDFGTNAGSAYILYGTPNLSATYDLSSLGGLDVTIQGKAASDSFGYEASSGGDLNADGFDDLLLGAKLNDSADLTNLGAVFIIYGSPNLSATFRVSDTSGDVTVLGKNDADQLGWGTSGIGDFNGDGFDDLLMGSPYDDVITNAGAAYILYGGASLSQTYLTSGDGVSVTLLGRVNADNFGKKHASAGDVNLDGFDDLIVGADLNDDGPATAGAAYILYGGSSISGTINAGNHDVTILGQVASDTLGSDASGLSDINNDGFDDVIAGAPGNDSLVNVGGAAYIIYGRRSLLGTVDTALSQENISVIGAGSTQNLGQVASGLGDVNDDGYFDFIVGATYSDFGSKANSGAAFIIYGGPSLPAVITSGNSDVTILGRNATDFLGYGVIGIGDINNDGISDIAVGTKNGDGLTTDAGAVYIIFGGKSITTSIDIAGEGANMTIVGKNDGDELGRHIGAGRMNRGP